jgi:aminoglycoside 6'-N-acetyltransferase I
MRVRLIEARDRQAWAAMRAALWPDADADELAHETIAHFAGRDIAAAVFVAEDASGGRLVGMLELALRSTAEGCVSSPVPFIEAWHVATEARGRGVGRALVEAAENWARLRGFVEIASDTELENTRSQAAHAALGFEEVERFVAFRKSLKV